MRLVSWNLHGSAGPDLNRVATALLDLEADVLALQEVQRRQARRIAADLGDLDWRWALKHRPLGWLAPWRAEGLAVLSRATIVAAESRELTPGGSRSSYRRRIALYADTTVEGDVVRVVNVHLATGTTSGDRFEQAVRLAAFGWLGPEPPVVVAGDVNTEDDIETWGGIGVRESDRAVDPTFPAEAPRKRIDRVFAGPGVEILGVVVPEGSRWDRLSDHRPLVVDLALRPS